MGNSIDRIIFRVLRTVAGLGKAAGEGADALAEILDAGADLRFAFASIEPDDIADLAEGVSLVIGIEFCDAKTRSALIEAAVARVAPYRRLTARRAARSEALMGVTPQEIALVAGWLDLEDRAPSSELTRLLVAACAAGLAAGGLLAGASSILLLARSAQAWGDMSDAAGKVAALAMALSSGAELKTGTDKTIADGSLSPDEWIARTISDTGGERRPFSQSIAILIEKLDGAVDRAEAISHPEPADQAPKYLTTHDVVWINTEVTGRVNRFNYVRLEEAVYHQYAYGDGVDVLTKADRFYTVMRSAKPFDRGNEETALIALFAYLKLNGYDVDASTDATQKLERDSKSAILTMSTPSNERGLRLRPVVQGFMDRYGNFFREAVGSR